MSNQDGKSPNNQFSDHLFKPGQINFNNLKSAHDHSPMGVLAVTNDGSINYANPAALSRYQVKSDDGLLGQSFFALFEDTSSSNLNKEKLFALEEFTDQEFKCTVGATDQWGLISSKVHRDAAGNVQTFLFIRDISKLKKKENHFSHLNRAASALAKTRDTPTALKQIADFIVPVFANWFTVDKINNDKLDLLILKHEDASRVAWAYEYRKKYPADINGNTGPALVIKSGKPGFVPVVTDQMLDMIVVDPVQRQEVRKIGLHSVIIVPLYTKDMVTGLANFISSVPDRHFDEIDLEFAEHFANIIGLALENAALNEAADKELALKKENEDRFRFLTDAIPHKMWTSGPDGRATYYNRQWHDYTGVEGFDALREKIWDFIHPDDRVIAAVEWPKAIKSGENMELEHRLMRFDGVFRWHLSRFTAFKNDNGDAVLWVGTSTDIQDQKAASLDLAAINEELTAANEEFVAMNEELASVNEELGSTNEELAAINEELQETQENLRRSEKLFRSIALNIPGSVIIVIDKTHRYVTIEGDIMEKMGYDRKNYEGKHPSEISPERYEGSRHLYERVLAGEKFSIERKGETGEDYLVHFVPLVNEHGDIDLGLIIAIDITEIKKAEEKSAKLAAIVESTDDAIVSKTFDSVVTSWNKSAERLFGFTADEMIGNTIYKIIPEDRLEEEPQILARLKRGERVEHFETIRQTKDGKLVDVSLTISPIMDKQGNIIGLSKIARDITENKLAEQRKNDFIGMVSHELKTPLTSLNAIVQLAATKIKPEDNQFLASAMDRANVQLKKMTAMINGFLNVSRLEAGQMRIDKQLFDFKELLDEIIEETRLIAATNEIALNECESILIFADRERIASVVTNLLSNAIKYSGQGKSIDVQCQVKHEELTLSIKDEGMGINPDDLKHIFDRYFRVETNYTRHISGFGIGLYLSAQIIMLHGGRIWAESSPGMGSTFYFSLPIKKSADQTE